MLNIALIGNPNSGKTTLYNNLTGSNQSVGNWPGVTVEKKSGKLISKNIEATIVDLPGIYSLSTISLEEEVASNYIVNKEMDLIINIVDASNLERNLFLTFQLLDSNIPMLIALNAMDVVEKKLDSIDYKKLSKIIGVPIIPISASKKIGMDNLIQAIEKIDIQKVHKTTVYNDEIESTIGKFNKIVNDRFVAIRFFEDGLKALDGIHLDGIQTKDLLELYFTEKKKHILDFDMVLPNARYEKILEVVNQTYLKNAVQKESSTDKIDKILTSKTFGIPIFALIMFTVFFLAFGPIGTFITNQFVWLINQFFAWIIGGVNSLGMADYIGSLITNGIFGGLAAVVGFLPQLAILFFALAILEDSGYMARAAFIMDRALSRFGLSGKSFIPMLIGFGCSVPAIANTRTLDNDDDRKITTMIVPFVSCGAKAPIYGVFAGALFGNGSFIVVFSMYVLGLLVAILSAVFFKKVLFRGSTANYIMELPEYRTPTIKNTLRHTWERSKEFLVKAGTILLAAFIVIWFFSYFGFVDGTFRLLTESEIGNSLLGSIGRFILPVFKPIGFTDWQATVSILTGIVAKESVVGTLGILYGVNGDVIQNGTLLYASIQAHFTTAQAYAFMTFALLSTPCIAAVSAMKRELKSWKWLIFIISYEMIVAYVVALGIYQLAQIELGTLLSIFFSMIVVIFVILMIRKLIKNKGSACGSCEKCAKTGSCGLPEFVKYKEKTEGRDSDE
ncbi:MAG: ferrous iron transport protein B [Tenericutes bacterium]|nr:ferrous iron transport protein B [Mycoplasmatota bacterium]